MPRERAVSARPLRLRCGNSLLTWGSAPRPGSVTRGGPAAPLPALRGPAPRGGVGILKSANAGGLFAERANRADGGGRARQRRDARDLVHHRGAPHRAVVEERLAAERRIDDELHLAVDDLVGDIRPADRK